MNFQKFMETVFKYAFIHFSYRAETPQVVKGISLTFDTESLFKNKKTSTPIHSNTLLDSSKPESLDCSNIDELQDFSDIQGKFQFLNSIEFKQYNFMIYTLYQF